MTLSGECADVTLVPNPLPFRADTDSLDISISVAWAGKLSRARGRCLFDSGSVAGTIRCSRYAFEPDQGAVERILGFRD